ncbi:MAG: hypothetical protein Q9209_000818 [Squamulea sp. 1 TL-2023]
MEALAAFSLTANVIQIVDFSSRLLGQYRELCQNGSLAEHRASTQVADALANATTSLKVSLAGQPGSPLSQDDRDILDLSDKCSKNAEDLVAEFSKLKLDQGGQRQALARSFHATRRKQWLEDKQKTLDRFQHVLETRILMRLDTQSLKHTHQLENLEQNVQKLVTGLENGFKTVGQILEAQSRQMISHIDRTFEDQERRAADRQQQERFIESLYFPEISARQEQIPDAFEGTCAWIFESENVTDQHKPWDDFRTWLETGTGAYWISGKPGAGKSTLMKYLVDDNRTEPFLDTWKGNNELLLVSFFFWSTGSELQKSSAGLLRSLVYQIASRWPALIKLGDQDAFGQRLQSGSYRSSSMLAAWTDRRLLSTLKLMLDRRPASAYLCVFIDGLDEFVGDEDTILDIIRLFVNTPRLKVCVSSRPEQAFREEFRLCCQLRVHELNRRDLEAIVQCKLIPTISKWIIFAHDETKDLEDLLVWKAQGVWLWLDLMIKDLIKGARDGDTLEELYIRTERTPDTIKGLYKQKLQSLDASYREEAVRYFQVLIVRGDGNVAAPISLLGLIVAEEQWWGPLIQYDLSRFQTAAFDLSCRRFEARLMSRCAGLLDIQEVDVKEESVVKRHYRTVNFIHRTVKEFVHTELEAFFLEPSWFSKASVTLARGYIGSSSLYLLNPELCEIASWENETFQCLIDNTMHTISMTGCSPMVPQFEDPTSVEIDFVEQEIQIIQGFYSAQGAEQSFFDDPEFMRCCFILGGVEGCYGLPPVRDKLSFAAYFGCKDFVKLHLSYHTPSDSSLVDIVLQGLRIPLYRPHDLPRMLAYYSTIQLLLDHGFDPHCFVHFRETLSPVYHSRWGVFFTAVLDDVRWLLIELSMKQEEIVPWTEASTQLVTQFLASGADPSTRYISVNDLRMRSSQSSSPSAVEDVRLTVEESPLSQFQRLPMDIAHYLRHIKALLLSAGAEEYRSFLSIEIAEYDVRYERPSRRTYRILSAQSQQLNESIFPKINNQAGPAWLKIGNHRHWGSESPSVVQFFKHFIANLSEEDLIEETFAKDSTDDETSEGS